MLWYADPAGASDIAELRYANFTVRKGNNSLRSGIAAVTARIQNGTLRILEGRCPNLLAEAQLYRYGESTRDDSGETPLDAHNHALAALRYLITKLDEKTLARKERQAVQDVVISEIGPERTSEDRERSVTDFLDDESLWIPLG